VLPSSDSEACADIVDIISGERGPKSDINIWRDRQEFFHPEQKFAGDKAYIGEQQNTS